MFLLDTNVIPEPAQGVPTLRARWDHMLDQAALMNGSQCQHVGVEISSVFTSGAVGSKPAL